MEIPFHFKPRSVALRGLNGVLTLYYLLLFLCFCNAMFLKKEFFKGLHYNVVIL